MTVATVIAAGFAWYVVSTRHGAAERGMDASSASGDRQDHLSRAQVRALAEYGLAGKLRDRELSPADYDRLVDAVMRLRAALRRAERENAHPDDAARSKDRQAIAAALDDIQSITGVPPSDLGEALNSSND
jgi:hypothetical protein